MTPPTPQNEMQATIARMTRRFNRRRQGSGVFSLTPGEAWARLLADPSRRKKLRKAAIFGGPVLAAVAAFGIYLAVRPHPQPDYANASIDEIFDFTLLKDEFNRLPIEQRLKLLAILRERVQKMGAGDSVLLAGFAAGIMGQAREQLEANASQLMIDMWDKYAKDYDKVAAADREAYLDETFVNFVRTMEAVGGVTSRQSDTELLAEAREQAQRDQDQIRAGNGPGGRFVGRFFDLMRNNVGSHATPQQRARGQVMMTHMIRRLRGQDISTGRGPR